MIRQFVENSRLMALIIAILIVSGLGALTTLPRSEDPRISGRVAFVVTPFPGASAERVESLVTELLENKLRELEEIKEITSTSRAGVSVVKMLLKDNVYGSEIPPIWSRARDLLSEVEDRLPRGSQAPMLNDDRGYAFTLILSVSWAGAPPSQIDVLDRYAKELESRLRGVSGTEFVEIVGQPQQEILVEVDNAKLSHLGLTPGDVSQIVLQADAKVAAGQLQNSRTRMAIEVSGELSDLERIRSIPVKTTLAGESLRLGDIADVRRQEKTPADNLAIIDGERAIVVGVRMLPTWRVDRWTANVTEQVDAFREQLPSNIVIKEIFNQDGYTQTRLGDLVGNMSLGFVLILMVLFVTLGWRSALIVAAALPLTVLFTLSVMNFTGLPIHQMSVTGLIVALGIMVDNAIVMTDAIAYERNQGYSRYESVRKSVHHLWLPLLGSTLTTVLTFLPIVLMPGPAGEFVGGIALSVIFSLIGSYIISLTIISGLAGRYLNAATSTTKRWWQHGLSAPRLSDNFKRCLTWSLRFPRRTILVVSLLPITGMYLSGQLTEQFFPVADRDMFQIEVYMPQQTSITATQRITEEMSEVILQEEGLVALQWFIGNNAPSFYYNLMQGKNGAAYYAQAMVTAEDYQASNRLVPLLQRKLDDLFPESQTLVRKLEQGPPVIAPIELRLFGQSLNTLKTLGDKIRRIALETPGVAHARATLSEATPKLWLHVDETLSRQSGLSLTAISAQLRNGIDGVVQGSVLESTYSLPVRVRLKESQRLDMADIENINIVSPLSSNMSMTDNGFNGIPLSALGKVALEPARGSIPRIDGMRVNSIEIFPREGVLVAEVLDQVMASLEKEQFELPLGYTLEKAGQSSKRQDTVGNLMSSVGLILTLLVLVVVFSFNSFRISGIIFAVAVQAAGLGLLSIYVFGYPFGFTSIIALMGLVGLAINAAIVILAELKANENAVQGDLGHIAQSVALCSRHITATTITTIGGFLPLILAGGGFWPPFAIAIAGGTLLTTLVSFFFVPAAFTLFANKRPFEITQSGVLE